MRPLLSAFASLALLAIVHLLVWRTRRPRAQYAGLVLLAVAVLALQFAIVAMVPRSVGWLAPVIPATPAEYVSFLILYVALALSYIFVYSAVQADSPSLSILLRIERAGRAGVTLGELETEFSDEVLVLPRLDDLISSKLARMRGWRYVIGSQGAMLAAVHSFYRTLLKLRKGG